MAVDDVVGCRIVGRFQDQNIVSTLHYQITQQTQPEHGVLQSLAVGCSDTLRASILARVTDAFELIGFRAFNVTGENKKPGLYLAGEAGDLVSDPAPAYISRTVTLYTDSDNYRRRGRFMLAGMQASMIDATDNSITDVEVALMQTFGELLIDPFEEDGDTFTPCLPATDVLPVEIITAALARKTPSLIRSRRVRGMLIG